jgi:flagellar motility protein MotE (MotC chaperone)
MTMLAVIHWEEWVPGGLWAAGIVLGGFFLFLLDKRYAKLKDLERVGIATMAEAKRVETAAIAEAKRVEEASKDWFKESAKNIGLLQASEAKRDRDSDVVKDKLATIDGKLSILIPLMEKRILEK